MHLPEDRKLTRKEKEVVALICEGYRGSDAAAAMGISPNTLKHHVQHIYEKTGLGTHSEIILAFGATGSRTTLTDLVASLLPAYDWP
jgi:DNA-binding CsgD family transcriptional regulator